MVPVGPFRLTIGHNTIVQYSGCTQLPFILFFLLYSLQFLPVVCFSCHPPFFLLACSFTKYQTNNISCIKNLPGWCAVDISHMS
ncbi:hypothetical protein BGW37DRAFT_11204 [Umbelopsis sp. PMI_123]|nr:hypothetical protein BGW37DRAFT_11204 [Umbelopsis sp. PMI_123]